jgi:mannose-1-phosphate guanylyltransferase/mannose-6-phosphate isomerase
MNRIYPIILSGGTGTRLWPISRIQMPKQLLPLVSRRTLLQDTVMRLNGLDRTMPPVVISSDIHRFIIAAQLQELGVKPTIHVLEPVGRNTAPAAAVALRIILDLDPQGILLLLPADHHITDVEAFQEAVMLGAELADGHIVTFGITPRAPETGYGYIRRAAALDGSSAFTVAQFTEKPDSRTASEFLADGRYYWNSGIFMCRAHLLLEEMQNHCPQILACSSQAVSASCRDLDFLRLDQAVFESCPSEPFDTAVMEHTSKAVLLPIDIGWSDVGSWAALWELGAKDQAGNVVSGDVVAIDTLDTYVHSEKTLVATLGVRDLVIVEAGDAVMVSHKDCIQKVGGLVAKLKQLGRREHDSHARVYRPWGSYELVEAGERYQVKHLMVEPGASLSLQMHHHRAEHWVVVKGTARVTIDDRTMLVGENESTFIPIGARHRLENPGMLPLSVIEVQSGSYLGEDDIVRFDDRYGRAATEQSSQGHSDCCEKIALPAPRRKGTYC